jgi:hypothetical protein
LGKIDKIIELAIGDMFPSSTVPDANNYLLNGNQYKAPDHSILNGTILIERKSRNAVDNSQYYSKFHDISNRQGRPMQAYGIFNLGEAIKKLPDPDAASIEISDYFHSQISKRIRETDNKFEEHRDAVGEHGQTRILIITDESEITSTTSFTEHFLGRRMGGYGNDQTGLIDSIFYMKNPKYVLDDANSYWFKLLTKRRVLAQRRKVVNDLAILLHGKIAIHPDYIMEACRFRKCTFRPLVV